MKKLLRLSFLILITIGITLYIKYKIDLEKDPYYFLQPQAPLISYPLKLYEKGEKINEYFWITPKEPKYSILFGEVSQNANSIKLRIAKSENFKTDYPPSGIFRDSLKGEALVPTSEDEVSMALKLYKINTDNSEILVIDENITQIGKADGSGGGYDGMLYFEHDFAYIPNYLHKLGLLDDYFGRYRVEFEVLQDWPQLKIDGMSYYLDITRDIGK